jgi:hypothetical protein
MLPLESISEDPEAEKLNHTYRDFGEQHRVSTVLRYNWASYYAARSVT